MIHKLYLDTCSIQRPLDTQNQTRIRLEAEAVLAVLAKVQIGEIDLVSSTVLEMEILRNPLPIRREQGEQVISQAAEIVVVDQQIEERATFISKFGVKAMDALHLACAEAGEVDYFCTCDDRFLRGAKTVDNLKIEVVSPLELMEVIEL